MKYRDIANQLQVSLGTVANIIKLWRDSGNVPAGVLAGHQQTEFLVSELQDLWFASQCWILEQQRGKYEIV
jgi:transposase